MYNNVLGFLKVPLIDSIGACAGFNSKSQFYCAFKKHKGMTPYQFVKKQSKILNKN